MNRGWLAQNLPGEVTRSDRNLTRFVDELEPTLTDIRAGIEAIPYYLDISTAPVEFVEWLGSWLGTVVRLPVDNESERDRRLRNIVHVAGAHFATRGTKNSIEALLAAATGSTVSVEDTGGVYAGDTTPAEPVIVRIRIDTSGGLSESQLHELVARDMPVHVPYELYVADRRLRKHFVENQDEVVTDTDSEEVAPEADAGTEGAAVEDSNDSIYDDPGTGNRDSNPAEPLADRNDRAPDSLDSSSDPGEKK